MYLSILLLPLLGSISAGLFGRKLGSTGSQIVTILCLVGASILASIAFYEVAICSSPISVYLTSWINSELLTINWEFMFDQLSVSMIIPVCYISTIVHIYSVSYMNGDPHIQRFFSYLSLFTFFMLVLVSGANYLVMFIGWEGIGVSSYLLINFFYTRLAANKAAILAFGQNRVGDAFLSVAFFGMIAVFGSLDFDIIFSAAPYTNINAINIIAMLLFIGAGAKSAVLFLHNWLPGSMEAFLIKKYYYINFLLLFVLILLFINVNIFTNIDNNFLMLSINPIYFALTGSLLGDGHLRFTHKNKEGQPSGNALFAMTLKSYEYIFYLWSVIYKDIISKSLPRPWPNPNTGLPVQQYTINSKSLEILTDLHSQWYVCCFATELHNKFIKTLPLNISIYFNALSLALWIMDDGYWDKSQNTIILCTDNFNYNEVLLLIEVLEKNLNIKSTIKNRIKSNKELCWRIRISGKSENLKILRELVLPYFIPSMMYKLGL
jgi:hypothetical protein